VSTMSANENALAAATSLARSVNAALAPVGWAVHDVTINQVTGFARVVAERRHEGRGVKITLLRSCHGAAVVEMRDVTERKPGMFRDYWEVMANLGRGRHSGFRSALRTLANYIDDNPAGDSALKAGRPALRMIAAAL